MDSEWISTKEAMRLLGVGSTTIKRWADEGTLPSRRTAGGHRRFPRSEVARIAPRSTDGARRLSADDLDDWLELLRTERDVVRIRDLIRDLHEELGDWFIVADFLDDVSRKLAMGQVNGDVESAENSIAAGHLMLAVSAVAKSQVVSPDAPVTLLASFGGRGLSYRLALAELCIRSENLEALRADASLSAGDIAAQIRSWRQQLVALCAADECAGCELFAGASSEISAVCEEMGVPLVVGFDGAPAGGANYGVYCGSFLEFRQVLQQFNKKE